MADVESLSKKRRKKTFVLDTNILIHDYNALESFEENDVVIPIKVIEELDNFKSGAGEVPYCARKALRIVGIYSGRGDISRGVRLPGGGCLRVEIDEKNHFREAKSDNLIISCAMALKENHASHVVIVSKDTSVRIKAGTMNVSAQDYKQDKTTLFQKYGSVLTEKDYNNGILSVRYQCQGEEIYRIWSNDLQCSIRKNRDINGISPKNIGQTCAVDALTSPDISVVALTGKAGSGKTLLALAASLHQMTKKSGLLYDKVMVARPPVPMNGYDLGFLPGDLLEKIDPWMQPIYDNLEVLYKTPKDTDEHRNIGRREYKSYQYLIDKGFLEIGNLTYIRGRSLPGRYVIIDEAQNLRPLDVKTLVTRLGEGSKIVFTGDLGQIDTPYLNAESNGLAYLIARLINEDDFCYLNLEKSARSTLADRMAILQ